MSAYFTNLCELTDTHQAINTELITNIYRTNRQNLSFLDNPLKEQPHMLYLKYQTGRGLSRM